MYVNVIVISVLNARKPNVPTLLFSELYLALFTLIEGQMYRCEICNKILKEQVMGHANRQQHYIHQHTNAQKSVCSVCGSSFSYASNLKRHRKKCHWW